MTAFGGDFLLDGGDSINAGRVGAWNLANSGGVIRDASPANANGIWSGPVTPQTGPYGQAKSFDGANNYATVPHRGIHDNINAFSYAVCTNVRGPGTIGLGFLIDRGASSGHWGLYTDGASCIKGIRAASTNYPFAVNVSLNEWHRIVVTYRANGATGEASMYADGDLLSTISVNLISSYTGSIFLGQRTDLNRPFDGRQVVPSLWNRLLQPDEIRRLDRDPWAGTIQGSIRLRRTFYTSGGTTYNDTVADAVTGAESFATTLVAVGTISGAVTAAESNATAQTMPNAISDAVTAAEASAAAQVMPEPITDDVIGGDAFGTTAVFNSALSDGTTASDIVEGSVSSTYNETIADDVTASDAMEGEFPNTGDTHDGMVRRTRRERALDAARAREEASRAEDRTSLRLALQAAMGMAAEAVDDDAPAAVVEAVEQAATVAERVAPALAYSATAATLEAARMALDGLHAALAEAARLRALADDDEDVMLLLRAL